MSKIPSIKPIALVMLTVFLGSLFWAASPLRHAFAGTINVNTTSDEFNNNGNCSLREAITAANTDTAIDGCPAGSGTDTINLPPGTILTDLSGDGEDLNMTGDYDIQSNIIFKGAGPGSTIIDGHSYDRVFQIFAGRSVQFEDLTIADGDPGLAAGGNIHVYGGDLTLVNSQVRIASAGSGIYATEYSKVTILDSLIENNTASGLFLQQGATADIRNSTFNGNMSSYHGGGIYNGGTLTIANSTISGNSSYADGGGIANGGVAHLYNVTITENNADYDQNNAGDGGGVANLTSGVLTIRDSILAGNADLSLAGGKRIDCAGTVTSESYNLIQVTTDCTITGDTTGNITNMDAMLGPLQDNGGPTFTHALLSSSPAIDAGNPAGCIDDDGALLGTDQRGYVRNGVCDIGAYEYNSAGTPTPTVQALSLYNYLPLILNNSSSTVTGTSTPTVTGTPATQTPTPTATKTPTPTQNSTPPLPSPTALEGYGYVTIVDYEFQPSLITIHVNAIVEWENTGLVDHTVTSDTAVWDSGAIAPSGKFQYQFTAVGNYPYHCSFHPEMTGMIIVVP